MNLVRKQRRVQGKKQNYWLCTETGAEFLKKPVRASEVKSRRVRSDKKCVSTNNIHSVVRAVVMACGAELVAQ